ncbi:hypothetical protein PG988_007938 [Apiospora saccharicola]
MNQEQYGLNGGLGDDHGEGCFPSSSFSDDGFTEQFMWTFEQPLIPYLQPGMETGIHFPEHIYPNFSFVNQTFACAPLIASPGSCAPEGPQDSYTLTGTSAYGGFHPGSAASGSSVSVGHDSFGSSNPAPDPTDNFNYQNWVSSPGTGSLSPVRTVSDS